MIRLAAIRSRFCVSGAACALQPRPTRFHANGLVNASETTFETASGGTLIWSRPPCMTCEQKTATRPVAPSPVFSLAHSRLLLTLLLSTWHSIHGTPTRTIGNRSSASLPDAQGHQTRLSTRYTLQEHHAWTQKGKLVYKSGSTRAQRGKTPTPPWVPSAHHLDYTSPLHPPPEVLLGVLLASLVSPVSFISTPLPPRACPLTLAGLPTFCPIAFHLFASYSLMAASRAALYVALVSKLSINIQLNSNQVTQTPATITPAARTHLVFSKLGVMHVLYHSSLVSTHRHASGPLPPCTSAS